VYTSPSFKISTFNTEYVGNMQPDRERERERENKKRVRDSLRHQGKEEK